MGCLVIRNTVVASSSEQKTDIIHNKATHFYNNIFELLSMEK